MKWRAGLKWPKWFGLGNYAILILLFYSIAASQTLQSFSYKWTSVVVHKQYSLDLVLNQAAPKPYAFRLLMPFTINAIIEHTPKRLLDPVLERSRKTLSANIGSEAHGSSDHTALGYGLTLTSGFFFLLLTQLILRRLAIEVLDITEQKDRLTADIAPILFCLFLSITYRVYGGFIYDYFELLTITAYLFFYFRHWFLLSLVTLALAISNKETAVFLPLFGIAISYGRYGVVRRDAIFRFINEFLIVFIGFCVIRYTLRNHPGGAVEWHFINNLKFWFSPEPFLSITTPHSQVIPLPKPTNIVIFIPIIFMLFRFYKDMPVALKALIWMSTCINLPLFILFAYRDEFRNLSLMFPSLYLAATHTLLQYYKNNDVEKSL